jgi:hypothetical protein
MTVAALYIDPRGPYPTLPDVDCWDESRDARKYDGPWPVVAHPPCGPWGRLRHLYKGSEHDCALVAVDQVRKWGGVLEHPAGSRLWPETTARDTYEALPILNGYPDPWGGITIEVRQVEWGHVAEKRTWLYVVGSEPRQPSPFPDRQPTHHVSRDANRAKRNAYTLKRTSSQMNRRTPIEFARYLVRLAEAAGQNRKVA